MPETLTETRRRTFEARRANPVGAFRALGRLPGLTRLFAIFLLYDIAFWVYPAVWAYFTQARFGWDPATIGLSLALFGVAVAIVQGGLVAPALRVLGERGLILFGFAFNAGMFLVFALISDGRLALVLTPLSAVPPSSCRSR